MKMIRSLAVLTALAGLQQGLTCYAAEEDGVALAIIYDTSGSMHDAVRDSSGGGRRNMSSPTVPCRPWPSR